MYSHAILYYIEKNTNPRDESDPPGLLNPVKLANTQPCWRRIKLSSEPKKRPLIIADWTIKEWSEEKKDKANARIQELLTEGFEVYLWEEEKVVPFTKKNFLVCKIKTLIHRLSLLFQKK